MANIAMCLRDDCFMKTRCYRFRAVPSPLNQSYGAFLRCNKESNYSDFWDIDENKPKNPKVQIRGVN